MNVHCYGFFFFLSSGVRKRTSQIHRCQWGLGKLRSPEVKAIPVGPLGTVQGKGVWGILAGF